SYDRHHKHTYYLIRHADIAGLTDTERELVARVARYHRRSGPHAGHKAMEGLSHDEVRMVRKLATLLRVADSLDLSHHQPVRAVKAVTREDRVDLELRARGAVDLELWDLEHERPLFRQVFGKRLEISVKGVRGGR
ncbi:MAG TPA: Ppx/GppA family phosphatase, partial [Myxococcaceae bacterium]|nr:Ppx/GppA family phosphatase [Myxococcaceae bacterium]